MPGAAQGVAAALLVVTAACGAGGEGASQTDGRLPGVEFGPWQLDANRPALTRGDSGRWDDGLIDPGAMLYHRGQIHSLYNAIRTWPSPLGVGYATSTDGISWEREGVAPVLDAAAVAGAPWSIRATSVIAEGDEWTLVFSASEREGSLHGWIGRATASNPMGPWEADPAPLLRPGTGGAWMSQAVGDAKLVPIAEGYALYFTAIDGAGVRRIGRASSADMSSWTVGEAPVVELGAPGLWDAAEVSDPSVARTPDGGWVMIYRGNGDRGTGLGWATSTDGIIWGKAGEPFIRTWEQPHWSTVFFSALIALQERHHVYFEASDTLTGGTQVYHAWRDVSIVR
jgi:predicted GH43/DUF377 family glycosyl hydrolase